MSGDRTTPRRRRPTKAELAQTRAIFAVLEPGPPRIPLWALMQHKVGTCGGAEAGCLLCRGSEAEGAG